MIVKPCPTIRMGSMNTRFEPYHRKLGCLIIQTEDGKWWVAHPNGDGEPATSQVEAREKALYFNATGGQHVISSGSNWFGRLL